MADVWSTVGAVALGGVGWFVTSFFVSPFRHFYDLRSEVIHKSVLYANVRAAERQGHPDDKPDVELDNADPERLRDAENEFRDLAARMQAFALNERFGARLLKLCGYDPLKASSALLSVSNTIGKYGSDRATAAKTLDEVLGFKTVA